MRAKKTFSTIFLGLVIVLMLLPFVTTFNELLTRIVENSLLYKPIEKYVVPYEIAMVRTIISFFGIQTAPGTVAIVKNGVSYGTYISWNCIGWQSLIILIISLKAGLEGKYTMLSKLQVAILGIIGIFFINLLRISVILILFYYFGKIPASIVHDYASVFISIIWLFGFWWFAYTFILEEGE